LLNDASELKKVLQVFMWLCVCDAIYSSEDVGLFVWWESSFLHLYTRDGGLGYNWPVLQLVWMLFILNLN